MKAIITFLLLINCTNGILLSQKNHLQIRAHARSHIGVRMEGDDEDQEKDETQKKLDEVDKLMNAADEKEAHEAYLQSPEYKKILSQKE